ncbi:MAG TPA: type II toxin-antitoxin system VapC family toxin, partial [Verrucomicrobiae bacterium]|nr:type II toxin-antitoxin system VapC family toxin [Verrucomicrobiae bacterium]
ASLIGYFAIRDAHSELADAVCAIDAVWVSPLLWRSEFRNTLTKYIQHAGMSLDMAMIALRSAEEIIGTGEYRVSSRQVLELAAQSKCTAYDCEYIALAQELGVPLVTADKQLLKMFPKTAISLQNFVKQK